MKSFASSLHAFNQTYHSLQRSAGALLHHAGVILPALVGLYAVATNLLFIPLMQQLWSLTLRFAPVHYLNNSNASDIFVSPAIILCLVVIALLTAFWALYEFTVLLHGLELARSGRPVQLPALLRDALVDIRHTFLPQNWPVLVYSAVLIPLASFFLTSNYVTQFAVPEYLLGVLRATTRYHALYLAIVVLLVLLFLSCALVLPLFCPGAPQPVAGRPGERRVRAAANFPHSAASAALELSRPSCVPAADAVGTGRCTDHHRVGLQSTQLPWLHCPARPAGQRCLSSSS